jgi:hypothetical protein
MKTISIKWSTDDVLGVAENMDIELTEEEADKILDELEYYHDAELGICWAIIENYIQQHIDEKEELKNK